jgi:hypothetical protein
MNPLATYCNILEHRKTLDFKLNKFGKKRHTLSDTERLQARAKAKAGEDRQAIADYFTCSIRQIHTVCAGITKPVLELTAGQREMVASRRLNKESWKAIAVDLHMDMLTLQRKMGHVAKPRKPYGTPKPSA